MPCVPRKVTIAESIFGINSIYTAIVTKRQNVSPCVLFGGDHWSETINPVQGSAVCVETFGRFTVLTDVSVETLSQS